jgi:hypothetical protein
MPRHLETLVIWGTLLRASRAQEHNECEDVRIDRMNSVMCIAKYSYKRQVAKYIWPPKVDIRLVFCSQKDLHVAPYRT